MRRAVAVGLSLLIAGFGIWSLTQRSKTPAKTQGEVSALFSGKEPKMKIRLNFPGADKPGFMLETTEIYQTASRVNQLKQALLKLFSPPARAGVAPAFSAGFRFREVFITDKGLAVIDLDPESVKTLPGGTSSEFASLYCLTRAVLDNFREIKKLQLLVGGETRESLAGHFDISGPLTLEDF